MKDIGSNSIILNTVRLKQHCFAHAVSVRGYYQNRFISPKQNSLSIRKNQEIQCEIGEFVLFLNFF